MWSLFRLMRWIRSASLVFEFATAAEAVEFDVDWEGALVDLADSAGGGECTVGEIRTRRLDCATRSECEGSVLEDMQLSTIVVW